MKISKNKKRLKTPKVERESPVPLSALRFHTGAAVSLHNRGSFLRCVRKKAPHVRSKAAAALGVVVSFFFPSEKGVCRRKTRRV